MGRRRNRLFLGAMGLAVAAGSARAQTAPTCSYDPTTASVTVAVNGNIARLQAIQGSGEIRVNGVACGQATLTNTDSIQVVGGALDDRVTLTGTFEPGASPEADASSEIEIGFALGGGADSLTVNLSSRGSKLSMTTGGIDVRRDLDEDVTTAGIENLVIADGFADNVICGLCTDDAEPDPLDTFNGCDL